MGISRTSFNCLLDIYREPNQQGSILQIGKQSVSLSAEAVLILSTYFGRQKIASQLIKDACSIGDELIFRTLGFDSVDSIDFSNHEGATFVHDLNLPVPQDLHNKYDLVYDGGSSEHVFDFPQVLQNYFALCKTGGMIAHAIPANNHMEHGFYMFSPTLLWDYYNANQFEIVRSYIIEYRAHRSEAGGSSRVWEYQPGSIQNWCYGWGGANVNLWFVVRKLAHSTCSVIPQQSFYIRQWQENDSSISKAARNLSAKESTLPGPLQGRPGSSFISLLKQISRNIGLTPFLLQLGLRVRKHHTMRFVGNW